MVSGREHWQRSRTTWTWMLSSLIRSRTVTASAMRKMMIDWVIARMIVKRRRMKKMNAQASKGPIKR